MEGIMKKLNAFIIISLFTILLPTVAHPEDLTELGGQHGMVSGCTESKQNQHIYLMNADKLGLSDEQIMRLRNVRGECKKECVLNKAKLRIAKVELTEALEKKDIDMGLVEQKASEISDLMRKLLIKSIKVNVEAALVLTDEQKEKAKELTID